MTTNQPADFTAALMSIISIARAATGQEDLEIEIPPPFSNMTVQNFRRAVALWNQSGRPLIDGAPARSCPACGGEISDHLFQTFDGYPTVECADCATWYIPKVIDGRLFERFFERSPDAGALAREMIEARLHSTGEGDVARVTEYLRDLDSYRVVSGGAQTYLDVGCNVGHSLKAAQALGYIAHGVEINQDAINVARQRGLEVFSPNEMPRTTRYSVVSFWETLEHINDPFSVLSSLVDRIDAGGVLAITVPNLNCADVRLLRNDCSFVQGGRTWTGHINLFSSESLERLLGRVGLCILDIDGQYGSNFYALAGYMRGSYKGIRSLIRDGRQSVRITTATRDLINSMAPYLFSLERASLATPILRVVACRIEDRPLLSGVAEKKRSVR